MNKICSILFAIVSFFCMGITMEAQADPGEKYAFLFPEMQIRGGLPFLNQRIQNKDSITITYFGGSITNMKGWRTKSFSWFEQQFPGVPFIQVNASIGGTNSQLGAYRLKEQVLKYNPDLVFVEFAVNDEGMSDERIIQSMEGIVRQFWGAKKSCEICFVYTLRASMVDIVLSGKIPHTIAAMEQVAEFYGIPSINFVPRVIGQVEREELILKGDEEAIDGIPVFSSDGVHPYFNTGHEIYAEVIMRSIPELLKEGSLGERPLSGTMDSYHLEEARMLNPSEIKLEGSWETPGRSGHMEKYDAYMPGMVKTASSGDKAIIRFRGTEIGCFDIMGPDAGKIIVSIDGVVRDTIYRFDKYCTYFRMNSFLIMGLEDSIHTASFEFNGDHFDKEGILRERHESIKASKSYSEYCWYLGKVLLLGEPVD